MASTRHMATAEDDARHQPGPESMPLWNESYWFPFYDAVAGIGVVFRLGMHPNRGEANVFFAITQRSAIVHSFVDHRFPLPPMTPGRLVLGPLAIELEKPLERFRLRYTAGAHAMDVVWEGISPVALYPIPPGTTADQVPRHIEHAGHVAGTVTIGGHPHRIDCLGHRDHSFGGERDWEKFQRWNYLSGEIDRDFWFNATRIAFAPDMDYLHIGCLWDGRELLELGEIRMQVETTDGGTRQRSVDLHMVDERGRAHHVVGEEVLAIVPVRYGRTWLKDGFTRYRYGERVGYGILEHGYVEQS